ncbi:MAG: hypothetical protein KDK05_03830 [Candidatus Competibacteraceae bacterium]|nr:hypothetical protein [Candidatus Competibacteraceae bacterium]
MKTSQVELTNLEIIRSLQALQRVDSASCEFDMTYTLSLNLKTLRRASEDYEEFRQGILHDHCVLDDKHRPMATEDGLDVVFRSDEDEQTAVEKFDKLNDTAVSLHLYRYPMSAFKKVKIPHVLLEHLLWMVQTEDNAT